MCLFLAKIFLTIRGLLMSQNEYVGGHFGTTNIDHAVFDFVVAEFAPKNMLDVGCGPMGVVKLALNKKIEAFGVDGDIDVLYSPDIDAGLKSRLSIFDFTQGHWVAPRKFDLIWSVEVAEHIDEMFSDNYLLTIASNLRDGGVLFFTHAVVGQAGYHHVNCKDTSYWLEKLSRYGMDIHVSASSHVKKIATNPYIANTGMVFVKSASVENKLMIDAPKI